MAFSIAKGSTVDTLSGYTDTPTTAYIKNYSRMTVAEQAEANGRINKVHASDCNKLMKELNKKTKVKDPDAPKKEQSENVLAWQAKVRDAMIASGQARDEDGNLQWTIDPKTKERKPKYNESYKDCMKKLKKGKDDDDDEPVAVSSKKSTAAKRVAINADEPTGKMTALSLNTIKPAGGGAGSGARAKTGSTIKRSYSPPPPPEPESEGEYEDVPLTKIQRNGKFYYTTDDGDTYECNKDNTLGSRVGTWNPKTKRYDP